MSALAKFSVIALAVVIGACGHQKIQLDSNKAASEKAGVLAVSADWIKIKNKKFDIQVSLRNKSKSTEIVWLKDVHCFRGETTGDISMVNFRHGDTPISLRPDASQTIIFTCDLKAEKISGPFKLVVTRVFDNPSADGRTNGKVLAKDITLEQADKAN